MRKHGSHLRFRSEGTGKGTTFYFILPFYRLAQNAPLPINVEVRSILNLSSSLLRQTRISPEFKSDIGTATRQMVPSTRAGSLYSRNECRVLVVDDSALNVKFLIRHVRQSGAFSDDVSFTIDEADDGVSALGIVESASAEDRPVDIVFMDNVMNVMHGPEAARRMRCGGYKGLIIGVTGNVMGKDLEDYLAAGADHILAKPITTTSIRAALQLLN